MKENEYTEILDYDDDEQRDKYLTFLLNKESYGIEIKFVTEIIGIQQITTIPEMPVYMKGVINLRGMIIPVFDLRLRFKLNEIEYNDRTCIVVVNYNNTNFGLIVDIVSEVINIPETVVEKSNFGMTSSKNKYIKGIAKVADSVKILINIEKLLNLEELESVFESIG